MPAADWTAGVASFFGFGAVAAEYAPPSAEAVWPPSSNAAAVGRPGALSLVDLPFGLALGEQDAVDLDPLVPLKADQLVADVVGLVAQAVADRGPQAEGEEGHGWIPGLVG